MLELLRRYEEKPPEIVFEWQDAESEAHGWLVINSLRGGAAGGGTRMHPAVTKREVESLAKTMELKFSISGPHVGGAKSGIRFDPNDSRKADVLRRWYTAIKPMLKSYYGTAGDLNIDAIQEVFPITAKLGIAHPTEGIMHGHFKLSDAQKQKVVQQLQQGLSAPIRNKVLAPALDKGITVADMITGYGVAESVRHYYEMYDESLNGKRVIIQGWGNVGASAAYYLASAGTHVVAVIAANGGVIKPEGFTFEEITNLFLNKAGNELRSEKLISFKQANELIWDLETHIFIPAAASRLVQKDHVLRMLAGGLELISSGANVPFADKEIFLGPIGIYADETVGVIPDFIANCGMARTFNYLMQTDARLDDNLIFADVSAIIGETLHQVHKVNTAKTNITASAFGIALERLM